MIQGGLYGIILKVRDGMQQNKSMTFKQAWQIIDDDGNGLVSLTTFSRNIDKFSSLTSSEKEQLFTLMDRLKIGLISLDQFRDIINRTEVGLRLLNDENSRKISDSFEWE